MAKKPKKQAPKPAKSSRTPAAGSKVDGKVAQLQQLIDMMVQHGVVEVEMEEAGAKVRVRLKGDAPAVAFAAPQALAMPAAPAAAAPAAAGAAAAAEPAKPAGEVFKSPMIGTFYKDPSPDAEPFAKAGDRMKPDSTVCIIEAMKVMNEIKAEKSFEILEVLVENGAPVEYGQPLFLIRS